MRQHFEESARQQQDMFEATITTMGKLRSVSTSLVAVVITQHTQLTAEDIARVRRYDAEWPKHLLCRMMRAARRPQTVHSYFTISPKSNPQSYPQSESRCRSDAAHSGGTRCICETSGAW